MSNNGDGESAVSRVAKLPVVESTLSVASSFYSRVKDSSSVVTSVLNTAESAVSAAKEAVQPVTTKLEGPIKKVDSIVCTGLDYVEDKVPQIKLPTHELYESAKNTVITTVEPGVQKVKELTGFSSNGSTTDQPSPATIQSSSNEKTVKQTKKPEDPAKDD